MKITTQDAIRLVAALQSFDQVAETAEGEKCSFKLDGSTRMKMARNITCLQEIVQAYQKTRNGLVYSLAEPGKNEVKPDSVGEFERQHEALLALINEVQLLRISEEELRLDVNPVPVKTLAALMPLLDMPVVTLAA